MKRKKLPRTPLTLYINLYCKKNNKNDNVEKADMVEATKSWLSLSEEERMVFVDKLNKLREEYKEHFAKCLENVEPYMKEKPRINIIQQPNRDFDRNHDLEPQDNTDDQTSDHLQFSQNMDDCYDQMEPDSQNMADCHDQMEPEVPEPVPPAVKTAEDLFNMVESGSNRSWKILSKAEKAFYYKSVLALKKKYIQKYKAYLESLPSEELYQYYLRKLS